MVGNDLGAVIQHMVAKPQKLTYIDATRMPHHMEEPGFPSGPGPRSPIGGSSTWRRSRQTIEVRGGRIFPPISNLIAATQHALTARAPSVEALRRRLVLETLPCLRRLIVLPMDHVAVNFLRRSNRRVPQPRRNRSQRHAARQQVRRMCVAQRVEARTLRKLQPTEQQRYRRGNRVRFQRGAVGIREYQIEVGAIVGSELAAKLVLDIAMCVQRRDRRHGRVTARAPQSWCP